MIRFLVHFRNGSVLWSENAKPFAEKYRTENTAYGGLAQLGERLAGSQKVSGSSPLSSTTFSALPRREGIWLGLSQTPHFRSRQNRCSFCNEPLPDRSWQHAISSRNPPALAFFRFKKIYPHYLGSATLPPLFSAAFPQRRADFVSRALIPLKSYRANY